MEDADAGRRSTSATSPTAPAAEFGFDFLRDRLKLRGGQAADGPVLGPLVRRRRRPGPTRGSSGSCNYAIVDEADSIFIDEARTPLIIANPTRPATPEEQVVYHLGRQARPAR